MTGLEFTTHLMAVITNFNDESESVLNHSFTKGQVFNTMLKCSQGMKDDDTVPYLIEKNLLTEFPEYMRVDSEAHT